MEQQKKCFKCNESKPITDFYKHPQMKDGRLGKCKICTRVDTASNVALKSLDPSWAAKERKRHRLKTLRMSELFPEKVKAHQKCASLRKAQPKGVELHHWSYLPEHQTNVFPLSKSDHMKIHCHMKYDQERMMYRDVRSGLLLDTKESAKAFYEDILEKNNLDQSPNRVD
jgi:hypothetical protein